MLALLSFVHLWRLNVVVNVVNIYMRHKYNLNSCVVVCCISGLCVTDSFSVQMSGNTERYGGNSIPNECVNELKIENIYYY